MPSGWFSSSITRISRTRVSRGPRRICSLIRSSLLMDYPSGNANRTTISSRADKVRPNSHPCLNRQTWASIPLRWLTVKTRSASISTEMPHGQRDLSHIQLGKEGRATALPACDDRSPERLCLSPLNVATVPFIAAYEKCWYCSPLCG